MLVQIPRSSSASGVSASGSSSMGTGRRTDDTSMQPENVPIDRKETWMVMEFCDVGILTSAIKMGWFFMDEERTQLNMVRMSILGAAQNDDLSFLHSFVEIIRSHIHQLLAAFDCHGCRN